MDGLLTLAAFLGLVSAILLWRRFIGAQWRRRGISTTVAALALAIPLPVALLLWAAVDGDVHLVVVLIVLSVGLIQFVLFRYFLPFFSD